MPGGKKDRGGETSHLWKKWLRICRKNTSHFYYIKIFTFWYLFICVDLDILQNKYLVFGIMCQEFGMELSKIRSFATTTFMFFWNPTRTKFEVINMNCQIVTCGNTRFGFRLHFKFLGFNSVYLFYLMFILRIKLKLGHSCWRSR